jgi:hypothetical protein
MEETVVVKELIDNFERIFVPRKTSVTVHAIYLRDETTGIHYITSAHGTVSNINISRNGALDKLRVELIVRMNPFDDYIRRKLPLFKNMRPDPDQPNRTVFSDDSGMVFIRIIQILALGPSPPQEGAGPTGGPRASLNGVVTGKKCRDKCMKKCLFHQVREPYAWMLPLGNEQKKSAKEKEEE